MTPEQYEQMIAILQQSLTQIVDQRDEAYIKIERLQKRVEELEAGWKDIRVQASEANTYTTSVPGSLTIPALPGGTILIDDRPDKETNK